jgi:pimeloyl-ACP methyl ester carboxylesterase
MRELTVAAADGALRCTLVEPPGEVRPGLLLTFAMTQQLAIVEHPHNIAAEVFLAAGRRVVSFDLPCHGDRVGRWGEGIDGMAAALLGGDDPFDRFVDDGRRVIDACLQQDLNAGGPICVCGISRAGYCALRLAAADPRIARVAGIAPVTDWRALREFAASRARPEVAALALDEYAAALAGRPVFLVIGNADARVGTDCCVRFAQRLFAAEARAGSVRSDLQLHVVDAEGHATPDTWRDAAARFLLAAA